MTPPRLRRASEGPEDLGRILPGDAKTFRVLAMTLSCPMWHAALDRHVGVRRGSGTISLDLCATRDDAALHVTSILVTHDQEEALEVADRVVVMNEGHIEQVGTPTEVFHQPASEFVMDFLGDVNVFHGRIVKGLGSPRRPDVRRSGPDPAEWRPGEYLRPTA